MNAHALIDVAKTLVAGDKGLLAMDESSPTCNKRFAGLEIPQTVEARRAYRELIVTTPGLGDCISGAILYDETIHQKTNDGIPFVKVLTDAGIIPGTLQHRARCIRAARLGRYRAEMENNANSWAS
jgi:fructose-bisphosphate aldolase, class I